MTRVGNVGAFRGMPHLVFVDKAFHFHDMGVIDSDLSKEVDLYQSGRFRDPLTGDVHYDDSKYNDKPCYVLYFWHSWLRDVLGNFRWLPKIGPGHYHTKYVVSDSDIKPHDVMLKSSQGDVYFFASLVRPNPVSIEREDKTYETLIEVSPHLSREEFEALATKVDFIVGVKKDHLALKSRVKELETENYLTMTRAVGAESSVLLYQDTVSTLMKSYNSALDRVINLETSTKKALLRGIETIEGEYNYSIPWRDITLEDQEKTAAQLRADIRYMEAITKLNGTLGDNQKQMMVNMTVNACGLGYVKRLLCTGGMEQREVSTPSGPKIVTMSATPTLSQLIQAQLELRDSNQISTEEFARNTKNILDSTQARIRETDANSALEKLKSDVIRPIEKSRAIQPLQEAG